MDLPSELFHVGKKSASHRLVREKNSREPQESEKSDHSSSITASAAAAEATEPRHNRFFVYCKNAQYPVIRQKNAPAFHFVFSHLGRDPEAGRSDRAPEDRRHATRQPTHPGQEGRLLHQGEPPQAARPLSAPLHHQPDQQSAGRL